MMQVRTLDTAFLNASPDRHTGLTVGAVAVVAGTPDYAMLKSVVGQRIQSIPRCAQLLRPHPTGPEWTDYPQFDLDYHMRRVAIPRPGDEAGLSAAIALALERPLDPERPPWECWMIEGLDGNRWAILMKVHHRLAGDTCIAALLTSLCDGADPAAFANHVASECVSTPRPKMPTWADALWRASAVAGTATNTLAAGIWPALRTSPSSPVTMRRYRTVRIPIADVDRVCRKFGVTANDVALTAVTEGFRTLLLQRGEQPRADSLPTLVPTPTGSGMLPYLPVEHDDPVRRLWTVQRRRKTGQADPDPGRAVQSALNLLPSVLRHNVFQLLDRLPPRDVVTLATTAPGPRRQLRLMGQTIERLLPIPPISAKLSSGVAVLSYGGELVFGITADYHAGSEVKQLAATIESGMAHLVALSDDSVLLFGRDRRRKRPSRTFPGSPQRTLPSATERARF